ncbi:MAG: hypothetical protein ACKON9_28950, partial [Planctomycetaceae bacterium]
MEGFWEVLFSVFFVLVLSPPWRTVLVLVLEPPPPPTALCVSLRVFAASRETNCPQSTRHPGAASLRGPGREGQISGWKARATENAKRTTSLVVRQLNTVHFASSFAASREAPWSAGHPRDGSADAER